MPKKPDRPVWMVVVEVTQYTFHGSTACLGNVQKIEAVDILAMQNFHLFLKSVVVSI